MKYLEDYSEDEPNQKIQVELMSMHLDDAIERYKNWGKMQGLSTGYPTLDEMTKGLVGGELIVIAGRTSNGKTMLGANIAFHLASDTNVMFVTMEQTKVELTQRFMSISNEEIGGKLSSDFISRSTKIAFQKNDELGWKDIDGLIETAKNELQCKLVVIDHLHYFTRELENVAEDLGRITKEFKKNAIRHDIPIILLSHVRKIDKRNEPSIEDLRGSCIMKGMKVMTNRGYIPIEQVQVGDVVLAINENLRAKPDKVVATKFMGVKPVFRVTLETGKTIYSTEDHRFFNGVEWKPLKDYVVGDELALYEKPKLASQHIYDSLTWLLAGWLVGDGSISQGNELCIATKKECEMLTEMVEGTQYRVSFGAFRKGAYRAYIACGKNNLLNKLLKENQMRTKADNKHAGSQIFIETDQNIIAFLRGYFHADGSVSVVDRQPIVSCSTISEQLANDTVVLLNRLGIQASIRVVKNPPSGVIEGKLVNFKEKSYQVYLYGRNAHKFMSTIGFMGDKQELALNKMDGAFKPKKFTKHDILPSYVYDIVKKQIDDSKYINGVRLANNDKRLICWGSLGYRPKTYAHKSGLKKLNNLFTRSGILWSKIKSIEAVGDRETYDIQTKKYHNFMAENFVTHNSYIGQDADIVLMMMKKAETNEYKCVIEKNRNRGYNIDEVYFKQTGMKLNEIR